MNIRITENVTEEDIQDIHTELKKYNLSRREPSKDCPIGVFLEDAQGQKQAGLTGETFGNWLCIKYLWVSENLRGQGIGSRILKETENETLKRGCKYAFVDTFNFQAPEFYKKHGYEEVFMLNEYPIQGHGIIIQKNWNGEGTGTMSEGTVFLTACELFGLAACQKSGPFPLSHTLSFIFISMLPLRNPSRSNVT